jgi:hypothetical protein
MEAIVDPLPRGPDWMPITPKTGSLFHAETHSTVPQAEAQTDSPREHCSGMAMTPMRVSRDREHGFHCIVSKYFAGS